MLSSTQHFCDSTDTTSGYQLSINHCFIVMLLY